MKQPHENVTGVARTGDDLISLDERAIAHRNALIVMAHHLRDATMVGNPAPAVERVGNRLRTPLVGDLVVEVTAFYRHRRDPDTALKGFGYLVERRREWWTTDEEWEREKAEDGGLDDSDRSTDEAWYIQYGPEPVDICRWTNCEFYVVPIDPDEFRRPVGTPSPNGGVTITRDDLLADLADSGFQLRGPGQ